MADVRFDHFEDGRDEYHGPYGPIGVVTPADKRSVVLEGPHVDRILVPFGPGSFDTADAYRGLSAGIGFEVGATVLTMSRHRRRHRFWEWPVTTFTCREGEIWRFRQRMRTHLVTRSEGQTLAILRSRRWLNGGWMAGDATHLEVAIFLSAWAVIMPLWEAERASVISLPESGG